MQYNVPLSHTEEGIVQTMVSAAQSNEGVTVLPKAAAVTGGLMVCDKCGVGLMVNDNHRDILAYRCWVCGNRIYVGHPKRCGAFVCSRCGGDIDEENELSLCRDCIKLLKIPLGRMKVRTYGEAICVCGKKFTRKSPTQRFHSKQCGHPSSPSQ
jgi:hypothetical protein